jgi:hypothetical protein
MVLPAPELVLLVLDVLPLAGVDGDELQAARAPAARTTTPRLAVLMSL